tara:strand:- start:17942 stop:18715 length:774 start_codon:yes stop_codon:yes gene_type:complete
LNLKNAQNFIERYITVKPKVAVILGSGLGDFIDIINEKIELNFSEIPGYILPTIKGHDGKIIIGKLNGNSIICSQGRFHFYEGLSLDEVTFPIQLFKNLGCENLIITNSSGCLQKHWKIGGFMNISSLLDFTFRNSNKPVKTVLNSILNFNKLKNLLNDDDIHLYDGCYTWTLGPSYETPAEINEINNLKGNVVGMSTYPEIKKAIELNFNIMAIACLTNYAAGISEQPLTHEEVVSTAENANQNFCKLIKIIINNI